jgi:hypothetical protein
MISKVINFLKVLLVMMLIVVFIVIEYYVKVIIAIIWLCISFIDAPGRAFRPSETAPYTTGNGYKTAEILPETAKTGRRFSPV